MSNVSSVYTAGISAEEAESRARAWNEPRHYFFIIDAEEAPDIYDGYDIAIDCYYMAGIDGDKAGRELATFLGNAATAQDLEQQTTAQ
ncbi:hypothetical protein [Timonella sp. A28]|uniref:hypothetical protein n=1 Tax=Timonella sp. A28 TaxID=3442640 RepID=UPI003EC075C6